MDLIITPFPSQFLDIQSLDRLIDHGIVSGTLKIVVPPIKKHQRKVYRYQKGDYESMRSDALRFAKEKYFSGYSDSRLVKENYNSIASFIQDSVCWILTILHSKTFSPSYNESKHFCNLKQYTTPSLS